MAGACFRRGDVTQGLVELTGESLVGSLRRALDAVSSTSGVPLSEIERLLPSAEMDALVARLDLVQADAVAQWALHMTHGSSLLEAIAKLTADGRPPEAGLCLSRIATKMRLEKALATPLRDLADLVDAWQSLLERVRGRIDGGKVLEQAKRRREKRRQMLALVAVVTFITLAAIAITVTKARGRIAELTSRSNPCEIELMTSGDERLASSEQSTVIAQRRSECSSQRERTRLEEERAQREKERLAREEQERRERAAMCTNLAERLSSGASTPLPPRTLELLGKDAEFLSRLARGQLLGQDVTKDLRSVVCADGPASIPFANAVAAAVVNNSSAWLQEHGLSASVVELLEKGRESVSRTSRENLAKPVDKLALKALVNSNEAELARSRRACEALKALDVVTGVYCKSVLRPRND